jgi:hypothetical protein
LYARSYAKHLAIYSGAELLEFRIMKNNLLTTLLFVHGSSAVRLDSKATPSAEQALAQIELAVIAK